MRDQIHNQTHNQQKYSKPSEKKEKDNVERE